MKKRQKGSLFIVSAPSGAGKTTLCRMLTADMPDVRLSVSYTTRPPRPGEINDKDYTFTNEDEFQSMVIQGAFAEWAKVHGCFYGTARARLQGMMDEGVDAVLDIDVQGAAQMKKSYSNSVCIFILPPSFEVLADRLKARGSNSPEDLNRRLKRAGEEMREYKNYDYVIVNDDLYQALSELKAIVISDRTRTNRTDIEWVENFKVQED